jgi:hypothetical protein
MARHWRLFEVGRDGALRTLFHGHNGTRRIPEGEWLVAGSRIVSDGTGRVTYEEGFHVFATAEGLRYLGRFRKPRALVAVEVEVEDCRPKPTNPDILLAKRMRVPVGAERLALDIAR